MSGTDPVGTITDALTNFAPNLLEIGAVGLGIGAAVLALTKGWRIVKKFF